VSDEVYLTVSLLYDGKTLHDLSGRCAGNKPLIEFIKPQIQRKFGCEFISQRRRLVVAMYRIGPEHGRDFNCDWSTPAKRFQVDQGIRLTNSSIRQHPYIGHFRLPNPIPYPLPVFSLPPLSLFLFPPSVYSSTPWCEGIVIAGGTNYRVPKGRVLRPEGPPENRDPKGREQGWGSWGGDS